jgi:hypothetical protein
LQQKVSWAHLETGSVLINILKAAKNPLLAIFEVKTRDFEEKSLKTGNFTCSLYFAEYYQFL